MESIVQVAVVDTDNLKSLLQGDPTPSATLSETDFAEEQQKDQWIREMASFLKEGKLPSNETRAHKIAAQAPHYSLVSGILYYTDPQGKLYHSSVCQKPCYRTVAQIFFLI